jgi:hypothetical protein
VRFAEFEHEASSSTVVYGSAPMASGEFWIGSVGSEVVETASTKMTLYHWSAAVPLTVVKLRDAGSDGSGSGVPRLRVSISA